MLAYHEHYTLDDYAQWGGEWELVAGSPYAMSPSPSVSHQLVAGNILTQLNNSFNQQEKPCDSCHALMEIDWEISHDTVVKPDVLIVCHNTEEKVIRTPFVIFEVSSPSTAKRDEMLKFELYQKEAVDYYILVYPDKKIAKVFFWVEGYYQKQGDFSGESFEFKRQDCTLLFNFAAIWR